MSFLTANRDVNVLVLSKLNFEDLRNVLVINREVAKYNNNILWFNYHKRDFIGDSNFEQFCISRPWKEFSLLLLDYKLSGDYNSGMARAAFFGDGDVINYCILKGARDWSYANKRAREGNQMEFVKFFSKKLMACGYRFG